MGEYSEFMAMWAKESGGYLWDDDIEEIKRDKERTKQEVSHRRASIVSSMPIPSTTSVTSTETAQETKEEGSAPEEKKAPHPRYLRPKNCWQIYKVSQLLKMMETPVDGQPSLWMKMVVMMSLKLPRKLPKRAKR